MAWTQPHAHTHVVAQKPAISFCNDASAILKLHMFSSWLLKHEYHTWVARKCNLSRIAQKNYICSDPYLFINTRMQSLNHTCPMGRTQPRYCGKRFSYLWIHNRPISQPPQWICIVSHKATFCNRNIHVCTFLLQNGALWDIRPSHCRICEMGLLKKRKRKKAKEKRKKNQIFWQNYSVRFITDSFGPARLRLAANHVDNAGIFRLQHQKI